MSEWITPKFCSVCDNPESTCMCGLSDSENPKARDEEDWAEEFAKELFPMSFQSNERSAVRSALITAQHRGNRAAQIARAQPPQPVHLKEDEELDCGDNSCLFAKSKGGMRTNGGCRCFQQHGFRKSAIQSANMMLPEIIRLRAKLAKAEGALGRVADADTIVGNMRRFTLQDCIAFAREALAAIRAGEKP